MGPELPAGRGAAGEGHHVLAGQVIEEIADAAHNQLERALGQNPRVDHRTGDEFGQEARGRGRFDDRRHAGEEGRGEFFEHAPDREVEGVDVDRDTLERHADVPADEGAALGQRLDVAVHEERLIRKLTPAFAGVDEEGPEAALDIDPRVALGGAGGGREGVELVLVRHQVLGHRLEHSGPLMEGHLPERGAADPAAVFEHGLEIEALITGLGHRFARDGVEQSRGLAGGGNPLALDVTRERFHTDGSPGRHDERGRRPTSVARTDARV